MTELATEGLITLYQLDTTPVPNVPHEVLYFTSATDFDHIITWGGQQYSPLPMEASGFEMTTKGAVPTPTITVSNLFGAGTLLLNSYAGLVGAFLTRILTLRRFLDDGDTPDPNAWITRDKLVVAQKTSHTALAIAFKMAARWDAEGTLLPRRQILRDVCSHTYRVYNPATGLFDYSKATCPYTGPAIFDANDNPVSDNGLDMCSRSIIGCERRFGYATLPARLFPGVGKVR